MLEMTTKWVRINGIEKEYKIVKHSGAVAIIAIDDRGRVAFVWQTRPALSRKMLEIPAGTLETGEDPAHCAVRELREETGCTAENWCSLGACHVAPGYSTEVIHLFVATGLTHGEQDLDDTEDIQVRWIPRDEIDELILSGDITDAKTLAALYFLKVRNL